MATIYWVGGAAAVAQVATGSVDTVDGTPANNTFTVTIGNIAISEAGDTDVATTAANLVSSLNASTHPYFAAITWTNPSSGNITATADTAGVPFVAALTVSGAGTGTVTDFSDDTAVDGPNVFDSADNWSGDAAPANSDVLVFSGARPNCVWNINTSLTGLTVYVDQSYTGKIGLNPIAFATTADGDTTDTAAPEYRSTEFVFDGTQIEIGRQLSTVTESGSARLRFANVLAGASICIVHNTGTGAAGEQPFTYRTNHGTADLYVRGGTVGVGTALPEQSFTIGDIIVSGSSAATRVAMGNGCDPGIVEVREGTLVCRSGGNIATMTQWGGEIYVEGRSYTVTTGNLYGGTMYYRGDVDFTTLNLYRGATLDGADSSQARTISTLAFQADASLCTVIRGDNMTISAVSLPASDPYILTFEAAN